MSGEHSLKASPFAHRCFHAGQIREHSRDESMNRWPTRSRANKQGEREREREKRSVRRCLGRQNETVNHTRVNRGGSFPFPLLDERLNNASHGKSDEYLTLERSVAATSRADQLFYRRVVSCRVVSRSVSYPSVIYLRRATQFAISRSINEPCHELKCLKVRE